MRVGVLGGELGLADTAHPVQHQDYPMVRGDQRIPDIGQQPTPGKPGILCGYPAPHATPRNPCPVHDRGWP